MTNALQISAMALFVAASVGSAIAQNPAGPPASTAPQDVSTIDKGRQVYEYWCATCHGAGRGRPGTAALSAKYRGKNVPAVLEERTDLTPQAIRLFTRTGVSIMPMFRKTEITDADLDAIAAYLTSRRQTPAGTTTVPQPGRR